MLKRMYTMGESEQLSSCEVLGTLRLNEGAEKMDRENSRQLPRFDEIVDRFSFFSASTSCNPQIGSGGSLDCKCEGCTEWHAFVEGNSPHCKEVQYEVFTEEHVKGLAHYLLVQAAEYKLPVMEVFEVGAGSGRLSFYLNQYLDHMSPSSQDCIVHVTASDSGERGLNGPNVNCQDALDAVTEGRPHVVLVSWMGPRWSAENCRDLYFDHFVAPMGVDWTAHARATPSVLEYILIGEMDDGICGDPWLTWGFRAAGDHSSGSSSGPSSPSTYESECTSGTGFLNYGPGRAAVILDSGSLFGEIESCHSKVESSSHFRASNCKSSESKSMHGEMDRTWRNPNSDMGSDSVLISTKKCGPESRSWRGETGMGQCSSVSVGTSEEIADPLVPPYEADGWLRIELENLSQFQICRTDERWSTFRHSHTVSFRRLSRYS